MYHSNMAVRLPVNCRANWIYSGTTLFVLGMSLVVSNVVYLQYQWRNPEQVVMMGPDFFGKPVVMNSSSSSHDSPSNSTVLPYQQQSSPSSPSSSSPPPSSSPPSSSSSSLILRNPENILFRNWSKFLMTMTTNTTTTGEWPCGKSQPNCDRTKIRKEYRSYQSKIRIMKESLWFFHQRNKATTGSLQRQCACLKHQRIPMACCQRAIVVIHKMGVSLVQNLIHKHLKVMRIHCPIVELMEDHTHGRLFEYQYSQPWIIEGNSTTDYRHVVVTRDWFDSILSGYLYHKAGYECQLDWFGRPWSQGWLYRNSEEDWELRLRHYYYNHHHRRRHHHHHNDTNQSQPLISTNWTLTNHTTSRGMDPNVSSYWWWWWRPGYGRDLCQYLAEETEEDGLRVYAAWAMISYMYPLWELRHQREIVERQQQPQPQQQPQQQPQDDRPNRKTLFLCFEDLNNPKTSASTVSTIFEWLQLGHFTTNLSWTLSTQYSQYRQHHHQNTTTTTTTTTMIHDDYHYHDRNDTNRNMTNDSYYQGAHATSHDPTLRTRLRNILSQLDHDLFDGAIQKGNTEFGCRSSSPKESSST